MTPQDHEEQAARMLSEAIAWDFALNPMCRGFYESAAMHLSAANGLRAAAISKRLRS